MVRLYLNTLGIVFGIGLALTLLDFLLGVHGTRGDR